MTTAEQKLAAKYQAAQALLKDEEDYVSKLQFVYDTFFLPLKKGKTITTEDHKWMFGLFETIYKTHYGFLGELKLSLDLWTPQSEIGPSIELLRGKLGPYVEYVDAKWIALDHYNGLLKVSSKFSKFILKQQQQSTTVSRCSIPEIVEMICARPLAYIQMWQPIQDLTPSNHPDWATIQGMKDLVEKLIDTIRRMARSQDDIDRMATVAERITDLDIQAKFRRFVHSGPMMKISSKATQKRQFFLFSDVIIYAKASGSKKFKWKGSIPLAQSWIKDLPDTPKVKNGFQMVAPEKTYTLYCEKPEEKKEWIEVISHCIHRLEQANPDLKNKKATVNVKDPTGLGKMFTKNPKDFDPDYGKRGVTQQEAAGAVQSKAKSPITSPITSPVVSPRGAPPPTADPQYGYQSVSNAALYNQYQEAHLQQQTQKKEFPVPPPPQGGQKQAPSLQQQRQLVVNTTAKPAAGVPPAPPPAAPTGGPGGPPPPPPPAPPAAPPAPDANPYDFSEFGGAVPPPVPPPPPVPEGAAAPTTEGQTAVTPEAPVVTPNRPPDGWCGFCDKGIWGSDYITLGAAMVHLKCFVCKHCNKDLNGLPYVVHQNKTYCEEHYRQFFTRQCTSCNSGITGKAVTVMGKSWHPECFSCTTCQNKLSTDQYFVTVDFRPCCANCKPADDPRCDVCGQYARGDNRIDALNKVFHASCFKCCDCGNIIDDVSFLVKGGKPCHSQCPAA